MTRGATEIVRSAECGVRLRSSNSRFVFLRGPVREWFHDISAIFFVPHSEFHTSHSFLRVPVHPLAGGVAEEYGATRDVFHEEVPVAFLGAVEGRGRRFCSSRASRGTGTRPRCCRCRRPRGRASRSRRGRSSFRWPGRRSRTRGTRASSASRA